MMKYKLIVSMVVILIAIQAKSETGINDPHKKCFFHGQFSSIVPIWDSCFSSPEISTATANFDNFYLLNTVETIDNDPKHSGENLIISGIGLRNYTILRHDPSCYSEEAFLGPFR